MTYEKYLEGSAPESLIESDLREIRERFQNPEDFIPDTERVPPAKFIECDHPNPPKLQVIDGLPRKAHKTTFATHELAEEELDFYIMLARNHELARANVREKIVGERYGIGADSAVHLMGKGRACGGCDMCSDELSGTDYYKLQERAREAVSEYEYVKPDVFTDVCPYLGCVFALEHVEWVSTVPQMAPVLKQHAENYGLIVDEEDTMNYWLPKTATLTKLTEQRSVFEFMGQTQVLEYAVSEHNVRPKGIEWVRKRLDRKLDELDNIRSRYDNLDRCLHALEELFDSGEDETSEWETFVGELQQCDTVTEIQTVAAEFKFPDVELTGPESEREATFRYIRENFSRTQVGAVMEAMFFDPRLSVMKSGDNVHINIVPDPLAGRLIDKSLFENAESVKLVGRHFAQYLGAHFHPDVYSDDVYVDLSEDQQVGKHELEILKVGVGENDKVWRRGQLTRLAGRLAKAGVHNLLLSGSKQRAREADDTLHKNDTYGTGAFFRDADDLATYAQMHDDHTTVVSYMGSRITRGVDVDTNVTIVRSQHFAAPRWSYFQGTDDPLPGREQNYHPLEIDRSMRSYTQQIEVHNAMMRGAGRGEKHVAVIPAEVSYLWDMLQEVTTLMEPYDDMVMFVLEALHMVEPAGENTYFCACGDKFLTPSIAVDMLSDHTC